MHPRGSWAVSLWRVRSGGAKWCEALCERQTHWDEGRMNKDALQLKDSATSQPFRPIRGSRAFEEVVDQLTHAIHTGTYGVGAHLPTIKELAQAMKVSNPTVLEAVRLLERAGVVGVKRGATGGIVVLSSVIPTTVFKLSSIRVAQSIFPLVDARRPIELELAALAVTRGSDEDIQDVRKAVEMQENAEPDSDEWVFANYKFHYAIGHAAHSDVLAYFQSELTKEMAMFFEEQRSLGDSQEPASTLEEHRMILRGLEARNPEMVRVAVMQHLRHYEEQVRGLVLEPQGAALLPG
jgi:GntR family transcriptional repressor for pyruvate dehydrogenase complex